MYQWAMQFKIDLIKDDDNFGELLTSDLAKGRR